jgi:serine protease Do
MRWRGIGAFLIAAAVMASATTLLPAHGTAQTLRDRLPFGRTHRIAKMLQTVVNITTHKMSTDVTDASDKGEPRRVEAFGSGFIIDPSGLIVTNRHVVEGAFDVTVILPDGLALPAKLRGAGRTIDIALIEVTPPKPLPTVTWGDSDKVRVGDQVLAVGNPLGVGESVSAGIVSAKNRDILDTPFDSFIQTDAAINHGNSGGPLFNPRGEVIGVNTAIFSPTEQSGSIGIGFAIPSIDARAAADQLRRTGELQQGWLGLRAQDVTPNIADAFGLPVPYGTVLVGVETDGPAARAGLQAGDVVLKFGKQVPKDARALARMIAATEIGQPAVLLVWRDHKEQTVTATVAGWPDEQPPSGDPVPKLVRAVHVDFPDLGLQTAAITAELRAKYKLTETQTGLVITSVTPGSAGDESGLAAGDVIVRVQQAPVTMPADLLARFSDVRTAGRRHVVLLVQDRRGLRWIPLFVG